MTRARVTLLMLVASLSLSREARGQPSLELTPPPMPMQSPGQNCPSRAELEGLIAGGTVATVAAQVLGLVVASASPHPLTTVDALPVAGAIAAAARNAHDDRETPLLLFSAGIQAVGILIIAAAATDLAALNRAVSFDVGVTSGGGGARLTVRF